MKKSAFLIVLLALLLVGCTMVSARDKEPAREVAATPTLAHQPTSQPTTAGNTPRPLPTQEPGGGDEEAQDPTVDETRVPPLSNNVLASKAYRSNDHLSAAFVRIVKVITPGDGEQYGQDVRRLFPPDVQDRIFAHPFDVEAALKRIAARRGAG